MEPTKKKETFNEWVDLGVGPKEIVTLLPTSDEKLVTVRNQVAELLNKQENHTFVIKLEYVSPIKKEHYCTFCNSPALDALEIIDREKEERKIWCSTCWSNFSMNLSTLDIQNYIINPAVETREYMAQHSAVKCIYHGLGCKFEGGSSDDVFNHMPKCEYRVLHCFYGQCTYQSEDLCDFTNHLLTFKHDTPVCSYCSEPLLMVTSKKLHFPNEQSHDGYLTYEIEDANAPTCNYHQNTWHGRSYQDIKIGGTGLQCLRLKDGITSVIALPVVSILNAPCPAIRDGAVWACWGGAIGFAQGVAAGQYVGMIAGAELMQPNRNDSFWVRVGKLSLGEMIGSVTGMVVGSTVGLLTYSLGGAVLGAVHGLFTWPTKAIKKSFSKNPEKYELGGVVNPDLCEPWSCCQRQGMYAKPCVSKPYHLCRLKIIDQTEENK